MQVTSAAKPNALKEVLSLKTRIEEKLPLRGFKSLNRKAMYSPTTPPVTPNNNLPHTPHTPHINTVYLSKRANDSQNKENFSKYDYHIGTKNNVTQEEKQNNNNTKDPKVKEDIKSIIKLNENLSLNTSNKKAYRYSQFPSNNDQQNNFNGLNMPLNQLLQDTNQRDKKDPKNTDEKRNKSNGFRQLHGRTQSNCSNRSNSKNKQNEILQKMKQKEKENQKENALSRQKQAQKQKQREKKSVSLYQNSPVAKQTGLKQQPLKPSSKKIFSNSNKKTSQDIFLQKNGAEQSRSPDKFSHHIINYNQNNILSENFSKDGNFKIVSRSLNSSELRQASQLEHHINLKSKKQSIKQLHQQNLNKNSSTQVTPVSPRLLRQKYILDPSKISSKQNGNVKAYAVNSNQGISRKYNEDRVSIILNITKNGVRASYFAIYDGHGGSNCCDFLTQNLHQYIFNSKYFPAQPRQALIEGMKLAETKFIQSVKNIYHEKKQLDRSGSCAIILLIVGDDCYIANLGDSRAVLSTSGGKPMYSLSRDHKPTDSNQQNRIMKEGGKIYRTEMIKLKKQFQLGSKRQEQKNVCQQRLMLENQIIIGPLRVFPGKLSVTRTFGDIQAKQPQFGGLRNCISTDPEICKYTLSGKQDFILLGCDGLFQKFDSEEVIQQTWRSLRKNKGVNIHETVGLAAQAIVKHCMDRKSTDNITAIIVCLGNLGFQSNPNLIQYASV